MIRTVIKLVLFVCVFIAGLIAWEYFTRLPFDSSQWKSSGAYENLSTRRRMCDDLITGKKLIGADHFKVIQLLGKPDQYGVRNWDIGYMVGNEMIDPVMFLIKFDSQKRVAECDVKTMD